MWLNLRTGQTSFEEAEHLAAQLEEKVLHVSAMSIDPSSWIESPGTETKQ
jgi:hypothetical protein